MNARLIVTFCLAGFAAGFQPLPAQQSVPRMWTDVQGRKVEAAFGGVQGNQVLLKLASGQTIPYDLAKLSPADQAFVKSQSAPAPATAAATATPAAPATPGSAAAPPTPAAERLPVEKRVFPTRVAAPTASIEVNAVSENALERKFIYQTEAFEFSSQAKLAKSVMTEVAQTFEATRILLKQLPWAMDCVPPEGMERYQAKLFETRQDYIAAGGPELSGGVYDGRTKVFMVPFQSIGLKKTGKTYYRDRQNYRNDTLVHEITHQLMDEYIQFIPTWVVEGTAEYTEMMPDTVDGFNTASHERGIKDYLETFAKRGIVAEIPSLQEHMMMSRATWNGIASNATAMGTLYYRSCVIVYYFNHLDGDGKGTRFMKFMDGVHGEVESARAFFKNPAVKRSPGGGFTYPRSLTPPDFESPHKHLDKLLDGRSYADVAKEMVEKYKTIGVKFAVRQPSGTDSQ